ncbi:MAG TPA: class I SAM-dependent methyltransferase [Polyangiaceae bacterium LLY-WYZ-15_(1-7)]|nr:class I SAM-dependent methyltransferase [Polyangiaceae bacterium LLY-WYZ-15_(1-7)]HJL08971.1 class I SAM-dependent methyltransferase [Polyangiaceae bacterium LLY-WYZ-15_(1-7)]
MELEDFADPWEQVRLLQDRARNDALLALLERRAAGARVLEVGTAHGLFACLAAKLGAERVVAVEASPLAATARALVEANGLAGRVEVVEADLLEVDALPGLARGEVDLAFGELLNADPFVEGVVEAMEAAAGWLAPGGHLAPGRLRVSVALVADGSPAEVAGARAEVARLGARGGLVLDPLEALLTPRAPYRSLAPEVTPLAMAPAFTLRLGAGEAPPEETRVRVEAPRALEAGGAAVLFEAELDAGLAWRSGGHFGVLVCGFAAPLRLAAGEAVELRVRVDPADDGIAVEPAR